MCTCRQSVGNLPKSSSSKATVYGFVTVTKIQQAQCPGWLLTSERLRRVYLARLAQLHQRSDLGQRRVIWNDFVRASSPMASARHHLVLPELRKFAHLKSFAHARDSPTLRQPCHAAIHSSGDKCIRMQRLPNLLATFREGCAVGHLLSGSA